MPGKIQGAAGVGSEVNVLLWRGKLLKVFLDVHLNRPKCKPCHLAETTEDKRSRLGVGRVPGKTASSPPGQKCWPEPHATTHSLWLVHCPLGDPWLPCPSTQDRYSPSPRQAGLQERTVWTPLYQGVSTLTLLTFGSGSFCWGCHPVRCRMSPSVIIRCLQTVSMSPGQGCVCVCVNHSG